MGLLDLIGKLYPLEKGLVIDYGEKDYTLFRL